jgi:TolB-like protein/DNA-binding winged helix-turn-helix (wHTH) protein/tetratricopeptide (TPR) repeat protein
VTRDLDSGFTLGGRWDVKPMLGTLGGPGGTAHLEPKVMAVLVCLAERPGDVVTRDRFIARVWNGRIVSDEVLSRCISQLRTRLDDDPHQPRFIQTVPKIGYRLVASVEPCATPLATVGAAARAESATAVSRLSGSTTRRWIGLGLAALLFMVIFSVFYLDPPAQRAPDAPDSDLPSIAVLPFVNRSDDAGNDYFSDGLTEELIERLAQVPGLQVVASTTAFAFKNHHEDVRHIAERLGVTYVLEGHVRKDEDRIRITAQLVDASRGFHLWSQRFDTQLRDIFAVQDEIARSIVAELRPRLAGSDAEEASVAPPTDVMPAYELLLQARYHLKRREEGPIRRSIELFERALELDPEFGAAWLGLASAYALLPFYSGESVEELATRAVVTLEQGMARNPGLRHEAWDLRAFLHLSRWEWIEAEQDFRSALATSPSDSNLHQWYSQQLARVGDTKGSLRYALAAKKLDVLSPVVNYRLAVAYLWVDDDQRALQQFELARELGMDPMANPNPYLVLLLRLGEYDQAAAILAHAQTRLGGSTAWIGPLLAALVDPNARPAARAALDIAAREQSIAPQFLYGAWLYLDEADAAMTVALEQLLGKPALFDVEFLFARETAALRRHPRYGELVAAIGLDQYWDRYGWPETCARRSGTIVCGGPGT